MPNLIEKGKRGTENVTGQIFVIKMWRGIGGRGDREKRGGLVRETGEEGAGSGIPKVGGSGRKSENYATLHNILHSKNAKRWEPTNTGPKPGL